MCPKAQHQGSLTALTVIPVFETRRREQRLDMGVRDPMRPGCEVKPSILLDPDARINKCTNVRTQVQVPRSHIQKLGMIMCTFVTPVLEGGTATGGLLGLQALRKGLCRR